MDNEIILVALIVFSIVGTLVIGLHNDNGASNQIYSNESEDTDAVGFINFSDVHSRIFDYNTNDTAFEIRYSFVNYSDQNRINSEPIMIIHANGTIWVKNGSEGLAGEQLAKFNIAYNSYLDGFCNGRKNG